MENVRLTSIRSNTRNPYCFAFSRTKCGSMSLSADDHRGQLDVRTSVRLDGPIFLDGLCVVSARVVTRNFTARVDERGINAGVDESATGTRGLGRFMAKWHSGQIQTYMGVIAVGMLALLLLYAWLA
jgi:hypothetical protein